MYREMRRKDRQVTQEEALKILKKAEYGILATSDEQNLPYGVPLSYAYEDHCIYFHCAATELCAGTLSQTHALLPSM